VKKNAEQLKRSEGSIKNYIKATFARSLWDNDGFYPIFNKNDKTLSKGLETVENGGLTEKIK
jgi:carboxyl-terminal processing protease